jgi:AcrR family transcriptional regulator
MTLSDGEMNAMASGSGRRRAIDAATSVYLAGEKLDMSSLADDLGASRATLYRWVGNRDDLLGVVLSEATERTYRKAIEQAQGSGTAYLLDFFNRVMRSIVASAPLRALTTREPMVFIRLAFMPGAIESAAARITAEVLARESARGSLQLTLAPEVLGKALVRICEVHLYAPLLGGDEPEIDTALDLVSLLLGAENATGP